MPRRSWSSISYGATAVLQALSFTLTEIIAGSLEATWMAKHGGNVSVGIALSLPQSISIKGLTFKTSAAIAPLVVV